jgi:2-dehydro-3-deoxygluconokinase
VVFYNRANEAAAQLKPGDFDWQAIFGPGVRWFHSGGIFAALSETTPELVIQGMQAAKTSGAVVSFDLNFREKLWKLSGGEERAREVIGRILSHADVWSATRGTSNEVLDFAARRWSGDPNSI